MPTPSSPRTYAPARIWTVVALILALLWAAILGVGVWLRDLHDENATNDAERMARALALQTYQLLQGVETSLLLMGQRIVANGFDTIVSEKVLAQARGHLPAYLDFGLFDAQGRGLAATAPGFRVGRSYADRDYFRAHQERDDRGLYVAAPIIGRTAQAAILPVSLRLTDPDGRFLGVLMAAVNTRHLAETHARFPMGEQGLILLLREQPLQIVARTPEHEAFFGREVASAPVFAGIAQGQDSGLAEEAAVDGVRRLLAWQRVGSRPLYLAVGIARADIDAKLAAERLALFGGGLLASLSILLLAATLVRAQARIGAALAAQRELAEARAADARALAETAESLNRAQAVANIGSWQIDIARGDLRWSTQTYRIFGLPPARRPTTSCFSHTSIRTTAPSSMPPGRPRSRASPTTSRTASWSTGKSNGCANRPNWSSTPPAA